MIREANAGLIIAAMLGSSLIAISIVREGLLDARAVTCMVIQSLLIVSLPLLPERQS
jgi:hypothetical protein